MESESNHHWMGVIVLGMGLLALLARTGKAPWAEYWPLLLIGIAVFIILQADSECWPVGWKSVGACMVDPEVFQHRMAALVCIGFAVFELAGAQAAGGRMIRWRWCSRLCALPEAPCC